MRHIYHCRLLNMDPRGSRIAFLNNYAPILHKYISNFFDRSSAIFTELTGSERRRQLRCMIGNVVFPAPFRMGDIWYRTTRTSVCAVKSYFGSHERQKGDYFFSSLKQKLNNE